MVGRVRILCVRSAGTLFLRILTSCPLAYGSGRHLFVAGVVVIAIAGFSMTSWRLLRTVWPVRVELALDIIWTRSALGPLAYLGIIRPLKCRRVTSIVCMVIGRLEIIVLLGTWMPGPRRLESTLLMGSRT